MNFHKIRTTLVVSSHRHGIKRKEKKSKQNRLDMKIELLNVIFVITLVHSYSHSHYLCVVWLTNIVIKMSYRFFGTIYLFIISKRNETKRIESSQIKTIFIHRHTAYTHKMLYVLVIETFSQDKIFGPQFENKTYLKKIECWTFFILINRICFYDLFLFDVWN